MSSIREHPIETAAPIRNFTIPLADKIRAVYGSAILDALGATNPPSSSSLVNALLIPQA